MNPKELYDPSWDIYDSSKLKEFEECPRKYFYKYMLGWVPETPNLHLVFGEAWHRAMEEMLKGHCSPDAIMKGYNRMNSYYRESFGLDMDAINFPKTPDNARNLLVWYAARYGSEDFVVHYTETGGSIELPQGDKLYFRLDSILEDSRGYFTMDHKTGSMDSKAWADGWILDIGITTYINVLYCLYPKDQVWGAVINGTFFRKGDANKNFKSVDETPFRRVLVRKTLPMMEEWLLETQATIREIKFQTDLLMSYNENHPVMDCFRRRTTSCSHYGTCGYHAFCTSWSNPLLRVDEPPVGWTINRWNPLDHAKEAANFVEVNS